MYIPDIPSITSSVIDRSEASPVINGGRVVLVPIFSKYGKEDFKEYTNATSLIYSVGKENIKKYGNSVSYAKLAATTDKVLTYRLLPDDATYANNTIRYNGVFKSYPGISSISDKIYTPPLAGVDGIVGTADDVITSKVDEDIVLSTFATSRGEGYNSIFITYSPATKYEKIYSDTNGETKYKFNFVSATIYEQTGNGIKELGDPIVFSLMDADEITGEAIVDIASGEDLFVNNIFKNANEFATVDIASKYINEMATKSTIDSITNDRLIVEDEVTPGKYYEVKVETYDKIVADVNGVNQRIPSQRLTTVITTTAPTAPAVLGYTDANAVLLGKRLTITDSVISFVSNAADTTTPTEFAIDGTDAFYNLSIGTNGTETFVEIPFLRHSIYKKLINYSMKLYSGFDGLNLQSLNSFNFKGVSAQNKQNAKQLVLDFYNNNMFLKEVLYPKYDFDYMADWTEDADVETSIINLADSIGMSMPILSLPISYDPTIVTTDLADKDLLTRKNVLFQSSYNSAMYSGQINKTHIIARNIRMAMPLSYYALAAHLKIDNLYSITEPVANIIKGNLESTSINLTYAPTSLEIESLRNQQINCVIVEPDGTYIIDQLTMYKKSSKLSHINVVKVIHRIRKDLPKLLKDLLQNKAIGSVVDTAVTRTENNISKWIISPSNTTDGIFNTGTVKATYNEKLNKLRLTLTVNPVGTLESIDIPIIVI